MDMYSDTTSPSQLKNPGSRIEDNHSRLDILLTYPVMFVKYKVEGVCKSFGSVL